MAIEVNEHRVIASRRLRLVTASNEAEVWVHFMTPELWQGGPDYIAPFRIVGIEATSVPGAIGVDPVQALSLSLKIVGAALYTTQEYLEGRLFWLDDSGDLGFPRP